MTRKWLLLKLLEEAGDRGITTGEILAAGVGSRYGARLMEVREAGYVVEGERERDGSWRYRLVFSPDVEGGAGGVPEAAPVDASPALSAQDSLFDVPAEATSHYEDAAA